MMLVFGFLLVLVGGIILVRYGANQMWSVPISVALVIGGMSIIIMVPLMEVTRKADARRERLWEQCIQDHKEYECTIMLRRW